MSSERDIERLLRWRSARAESDAPPAPTTRLLLERARPWWERWPERLSAHMDRLQGMRLVYAHAASDPTQATGPYPVPALLVRVGEELEASARVLYFSVRDGRLRMRFRLDAGGAIAEPTLDVTFVSDDPSGPVLSAMATQSVDHEYHLQAELPEALESRWGNLRVTERMPFRFILHSGAASE